MKSIKHCFEGATTGFPCLDDWRQALVGNEIVKGSVVPDFSDVFEGNLRKPSTYAAAILEAA